jgi:hypothetical protein
MRFHLFLGDKLQSAHCCTTAASRVTAKHLPLGAANRSENRLLHVTQYTSPSCISAATLKPHPDCFGQSLVLRIEMIAPCAYALTPPMVPGSCTMGPSASSRKSLHSCLDGNLCWCNLPKGNAPPMPSATSATKTGRYRHGQHNPDYIFASPDGWPG